MRLSEHSGEHTHYDHLSLLYIEAAERSAVALQRAARRVRRNIRSIDELLLLETSCSIVLPGTTLAGAEAVARRLAALLTDVEHELQITHGPAAFKLLERLQSQHPQVVAPEVEPFDLPSEQAWQPGERDMIPFLAFLANYPSPRLLHLFPYELAARYQCVPVGAERGILTLATSQPLDNEVVGYLQLLTQRNIFQVRCESSMIQEILRYWQRIEQVISMQMGQSL